MATMSRFLSSKRETISPTSLRSTASGLSRTKVRSDMAGNATGSPFMTVRARHLPSHVTTGMHFAGVTVGAWPLPSVREVSQHWAGGAGDVDAAGCQDGVVGVCVLHRRLTRLLDRVVDVDLAAAELAGGLADLA